MRCQSNRWSLILRFHNTRIRQRTTKHLYQETTTLNTKSFPAFISSLFIHSCTLVFAVLRHPPAESPHIDDPSILSSGDLYAQKFSPPPLASLWRSLRKKRPTGEPDDFLSLWWMLIKLSCLHQVIKILHRVTGARGNSESPCFRTRYY